jgi:hypothetical protein
MFQIKRIYKKFDGRGVLQRRNEEPKFKVGKRLHIERGRGFTEVLIYRQKIRSEFNVLKKKCPIGLAVS